MKALEGFQINSKSVCDCHQFLVKLVAHSRIQPAWMPGHMGIDGNELADQLAKNAPHIYPQELSLHLVYL